MIEVSGFSIDQIVDSSCHSRPSFQNDCDPGQKLAIPFPTAGPKQSWTCECVQYRYRNGGMHSHVFQPLFSFHRPATRPWRSPATRPGQLSNLKTRTSLPSTHPYPPHKQCPQSSASLSVWRAQETKSPSYTAFSLSLPLGLTFPQPVLSSRVIFSTPPLRKTHLSHLSPTTS